MTQKQIEEIRQVSRKLVRELGMLELMNKNSEENPQTWHALIEIEKNPAITVSQLSRNLVLHISSTSRLVDDLQKQKFIDEVKSATDARKRALYITKKGLKEIERINEFSISKISNAFRFLGKKDRDQIIESIEKYASALQKARLQNEIGQVKIRTITTDRNLRLQIKNMIQEIQQNEYNLGLDESINDCVMNAEEDFYFGKRANFFYAVNEKGEIIGSVGLAKIDKDSGEIKKFFVHRDYRGQKIGKALMQRLVLIAKKHKFKDLYLGTITELKAAQNFYLEHGFQEILPRNLPEKYKRNDVDNLFFHAKVENCNF